MKKFLTFVVILALVVFAVSCSSGDEKKEETKEETKTEQVEENKQESKDEEEKPEEEAKEESSEEVTQESSGEKDVDLLKSLMYEEPKSISFKATITIQGMGESTMSMYSMGENYRMENELNGEVNVVIYNHEEGMTYTYVEGQKTGYKYPTASDSTTMEVDTSFEIEEDEMDYYDVIKKDKLDGKDVIYLESKDTNSDGTFITKSWISEEYRMPLKMQVIDESGSVISEMVYSDIVIDADISDKFIPPSDVSFE